MNGQHPRHANNPRYTQGTEYAQVANGLIELANLLDEIARKLKQHAKEVRRGDFLSDFAYSHGRNVIHDVRAAIDRTLPEPWDERARLAALVRHNAAVEAQAAGRCVSCLGAGFAADDVRCAFCQGTGAAPASNPIR